MKPSPQYGLGCEKPAGSLGIDADGVGDGAGAGVGAGAGAGVGVGVGAGVAAGLAQPATTMTTTTIAANKDNIDFFKLTSSLVTSRWSYR